MSANDYLIDASTRHAVFIQRYGGGASKEAQELLNRLKRKILARLAQEPTDFRRNRLEAMLVDVKQLSFNAFGDIKNKSIANAKAFAEEEMVFTTKLVDRVSSKNIEWAVPSAEQLSAAVITTPMDAKLGASKITIDEALSQYGKKKTAEIIQTINDGILLGDTTPTVSKAVAELMNNRQANQLETLTRTIINHSSSVARNDVYDQNSDVIDGFEWVSTLDSRTTLICGARDGKIFPTGSPMPPAHWNCRSTTIPNVKPEFTVVKLDGRRPQKGDTTGTTSAKTTYGSWLKKQSKAFQDEALGRDRAALFRSGKLKIDQFIDPTGQTYSLKQLRSMYPLAFEANAAKVVAPVIPAKIPKPKVKTGVSLSGVDADVDLAPYEVELNKSHDKHIDVMNKHPKPNTISAKGGGSYSIQSQTIVTNLKSGRGGATLRHEYGHHIDYMLYPDYSWGAISSTDTAFLKAYDADRKLLGLRASKTKFESMKALHADMYETVTQTLSSGRTVSRSIIRNDNYAGVSDIVDALTHGQFQNNFGGFGHGVKYYKRKDARYHEIFANLFQLRGTRHWDYVHEKFPNMAKRFEEIIDEALL